MIATIFGITIFQTVIAVFAFIVYVAIQLALGWESHQRYGTGYYWVGANFAGAIAAFFNYQYWIMMQSSEDYEYHIISMILVNIFLCLIGLWSYLIYFGIMQKRGKHYRAGARLERRIFASDQAATGTGRFRDQLEGWEGDMKLDALIVEGKFEEAEDYLEGVILSSSSERDLQKARFYEQYRKVIMRERIFFEESKEFRTEESKKETDERKVKTSDFGKAKELKQDDMPEGWHLPE